MPRHQGLLPGRQLRVGRPQLAVRHRRQPRHLLGNVDAVGLRHAPELLDFAFQFGDRLFEVEVVAHGARALAQISGAERPAARSPAAALPDAALPVMSATAPGSGIGGRCGGKECGGKEIADGNAEQLAQPGQMLRRDARASPLIGLYHAALDAESLRQIILGECESPALTSEFAG